MTNIEGLAVKNRISEPGPFDPGPFDPSFDPWEAIIDAKITRTKEMGCFVAGTMVHTKEELKPIEQIQIGDLVLSRHESGQGELCYSPVTRTFQYENREVYFVTFQLREAGTGKPTKERGHMVVTGAHPIWLTRIAEYPMSNECKEQPTEVNGWVSIEEIYLSRWKDYWEQLGGAGTPYVELADGRVATIGFIEPVLQSDEPDIGVGFRDSEHWVDDTSGTEIYFTQAGPEISYGQNDLGPKIKPLGVGYVCDPDYNAMYDKQSPLLVAKRSQGFLPMQRTVYNLEVADTHSYFVTEKGLWVHNTSGIEVTAIPQTPTKHLDVYVGVKAKKSFMDEPAKQPDGKGLGVES